MKREYEKADLPLSDILRDSICSSAEFCGASEAVLFGSSVKLRRNEHIPKDIDIALLGIPFNKIECLEHHLTTRFSGCVVDVAMNYVGGHQHRGEIPLHFVLATKEMRNSEHPIFRSIEAGISFWRSE